MTTEKTKNIIDVKCKICGHDFRKKCKKVCHWEHEAVSFYSMFEDGYIGEDTFVENIFPDYDEDKEFKIIDKFYDNKGKILPKYGVGKCPYCRNKFWFKRNKKNEE